MNHIKLQYKIAFLLLVIIAPAYNKVQMLYHLWSVLFVDFYLIVGCII